MKTRAGLPAVGRPTMLGLNLTKSLEIPSWLRILPTATATTPKNLKRHDVATTSSPSNPTTSHDLPQTSTWEPLDTCLQSNGAMQPFHALIEQSLLHLGTVEPKNEGIASSIKQLPIQRPYDTITSRLEGCGLTSTIPISDSADDMLEETTQSTDHLPAPTDKQVSSFTTPSSLLGDEDAFTPFGALFPDHLLSDRVGDIANKINDTVPVLELPSLCPLIAHPLSHDSHISIENFLGSNFTTTIKAHDFSLFIGDSPSEDIDGRTSPHLSTTTRDSFSSLSDSPNSSRRSSWATSISTHLGDDDIDQSSLEHAKLTTKPELNGDEIELVHEYQHCCQLIELGDPQNRRDRDFVAQESVEKRPNEETTSEKFLPAAVDLAVEASRVTVSDDPKAPIVEDGSDPKQGRMQPESMQPDTQSAFDSEGKNTPPSTAAEAEAWAHSYCDTDDSTKIKFLTDNAGRQYVLYHDCFHCVPIEMLPEFMDTDEEDDDDDEDDGYGSANETCEAGSDGAKLGTIPEDENEG